MNSIELSVIIPTLNEEMLLPETLSSLAAQQLVGMEVIVSDGGSSDRTVEIAGNVTGLPVQLVIGAPGRSRQLNRGAAAARGEFILFLHADSRFHDTLALRQGIDHLLTASSITPETKLAGHFRLSFRRSDPAPSLGYAYYEAKARLDRPGCTHGDQGFLMKRATFSEAGPFPERWPMLGETCFAESIRQQGRWLLLPADIETSARRLEREGLGARQTLNAIIMAAAAVRWDDFFNCIPKIYTTQDRSTRLDLHPVLMAIKELISLMPKENRREFWAKIGAYVRDNAWQVALFLDVYLNHSARRKTRKSAPALLEFFDHNCASIIAATFGAKIATQLTRIWFHTLVLLTRKMQ